MMITKCRYLWYLSCFAISFALSHFFPAHSHKQNVSQSGIFGLVAANRRPDYC